MQAVLSKKREAIRARLQAGADPNEADNDNYTALILSVAGKVCDAASVQMLLDAGADINLSELHGGTPLMFAVDSGHRDAVRLLLEAGADVHAQAGFMSTTALAMAKERGHADLVQLLRFARNIARPVVRLLHFGQNTITPVVHRDKEQGEALCFAAALGNTDEVRRLLNEGVPVDARNRIGQSAFVRAVLGGHVETARLLFAHGARINITTNYGHIGTACEPLLLATLKFGQPALVHLLLDWGARIDTASKYEAFPLHEAISQHDIAMVRHMLERGANINAQDRRGHTPFRLSVYSPYYPNSTDPEITRLLIEMGANVNLADEEGMMPLMCAASSGNQDMVRCLLVAGATVNLCSRYGASALSLAQAYGYQEIVSWLLEAGAYELPKSEKIAFEAVKEAELNPPAEIHFAAWYNKIDLLRQLLGDGADINEQFQLGWTALIRASYEGHIEIVRLLLKRGADVHIESYDGTTALYEATMRGFVEIMTLLHAYGARVAVAEYNHGRTPLHQKGE